jgi:mono/diheme cytochrome c family protein
MRKSLKLTIVFLLIGSIWLGLVACKSASEGTATPPGEATEEATRITDATVPATHEWKQPTSIIQIQDTPTGAPSTPASADDKTIARGKMLYEKNECHTCHGERAEGLPDKGAALAGTSLAVEEFEDILRTGARGRLGNDHLYGTSAITSSGIKAVHAYLQSLGD